MIWQRSNVKTKMKFLNCSKYLSTLSYFLNINKIPKRSYCSTMSKNVILNGVWKIEKIVWIDLEMTGLDIKNDRIMEIACVLTDKDLNVLAEFPTCIIKQSPEILNSMGTWCTKTHGKTGLTKACLNSTITESDVEKQIISFFQEHNVLPNVCPLAGNSVYMDRFFLKEYMPQIDNYLHYRIIDVSTVKELCARWNPTIYNAQIKKKFVHRAIDDIHESINELKYYKQFMFI